MSIERVTAKYEKDGAFYLTVVLDDFYHLPDQKISLQTTESIYENVIHTKKKKGNPAFTLRIFSSRRERCVLNLRLSESKTSFANSGDNAQFSV